MTDTLQARNLFEINDNHTHVEDFNDLSEYKEESDTCESPKNSVDVDVNFNVQEKSGSLREHIEYQQKLEQQYTCPLTLDFMLYPIKASDNQIYERYAILEWFFLHKTSPMTREQLTLSFEPQKNLQLEIRKYLKNNNLSCPVLPDNGLRQWKKIIILQNIDSGNNNYSSSSNRSNRSSSHRSSNRSSREGDNLDNRDRTAIDRYRERDIISYQNRRSDSHTRIVVCDQCHRRVRILNFHQHPFQTCQCGQMITLFSPQSSRNGCILM